MVYANPYTPGAGFMPAYLAGRDALVDEAETMLHSLQAGYPQQSVIFHGLRGVGKTVLLNRIEEITEDLGILYEQLEVKERSDFATQITTIAYKFVKQMSVKEKAKSAVQNLLTILKQFSVTYSPEDKSFSLSPGDAELSFTLPKNFPEDLTDVFLALGSAAVKSENTICFFIDEIQYLKKEELEALANAIHRVNQKRLPIMVFGAGLPKILKDFGDAKSYSERLFKFIQIDSLSHEAAQLAITAPAQKLGVSYDQAAVDRILEVTDGYPYFIQEFCNVIWTKSGGHRDICLDDVTVSEQDFYQRLDEGFFMVRYKRCTTRELEFLFSMVRCESLPCTISNVAKQMHKPVSSISPIRAQLINKGLIYATHYGEVDFTVPQFDAFLHRVNPELG
jgi:hypothetical protein